MREMKDSGVEWIGKIPTDWMNIRLKYVCELKTGGTPSGKTGIDFIGDHKWFTPVDFNDTFHIRESKQYISDETLRQNGYSLFPANSILLVCIASVGKIGIIDEPSYSNQQITALKPKNNILPLYLLYGVTAGRFQIQFDAASNVVPIVNTQYLKSFSLPFPDINVQKKIASHLEIKCAEIDALTHDIQSQIDTMQQYKQSVITEAVTKGLDPDVEMKDSGVEWIGMIPKEWELKKAKYCVIISNGSDPHYEGNIPVYGSGAESFKTCGEYKEGPAVLIGRKGATLHIPHYIKGRYWNVDTAFDVKALNNFLLRYYYYLAISFDYKYYISQTTLPSMTQGNYYNMRIPCPGLDEQQKIVAYLDTKCTEIDEIIAEKNKQLDILADYKKSLIYEYVTGKKEVPSA